MFDNIFARICRYEKLFPKITLISSTQMINSISRDEYLNYLKSVTFDVSYFFCSFSLFSGL